MAPFNEPVPPQLVALVGLYTKLSVPPGAPPCWNLPDPKLVLNPPVSSICSPVVIVLPLSVIEEFPRAVPLVHTGITFVVPLPVTNPDPLEQTLAPT
jgi:hypothetical protein